jgi:ribosomal protein S18
MRSPHADRLLDLKKVGGDSRIECVLTRLEGPLANLNYTDVLVLSQFLRPDGSVLPRSVTKLTWRQHNRIEKFIWQARKAGLLPADSSKPPFTLPPCTQRSVALFPVPGKPEGAQVATAVAQKDKQAVALAASEQQSALGSRFAEKVRETTKAPTVTWPLPSARAPNRQVFNVYFCAGFPKVAKPHYQAPQ